MEGPPQREGPAPAVASSAQMAGAMAASWTNPLQRSLWGDIPSPLGLWKALASRGLEPGFFLGCGLPPRLQPRYLRPRSPCGARSLEGLGPGPRSGDQHTAHHCECSR